MEWRQVKAITHAESGVPVDPLLYYGPWLLLFLMLLGHIVLQRLWKSKRRSHAGN